MVGRNKAVLRGPAREHFLKHLFFLLDYIAFLIRSLPLCLFAVT